MRINTRQVNLCLAERGMTRAQLAEKSGIARTNISTVLGRGTCTAVTLNKIARGLGVAPALIMGQDQEAQ